MRRTLLFLCCFLLGAPTFADDMTLLGVGQQPASLACSGSAGTLCPDGTIIAGITPDGSVTMYVTPCDYGMTGTQNSCSGTATTETWATVATTTGVTNNNTGKANTATLHSLADGGQPYNAANACYNLNANGHTDWYLPANAELTIIATNIGAIGGYTCFSNLWSSTEFNSLNAYSALICNSTGNNQAKTSNSFNIRCARHN